MGCACIISASQVHQYRSCCKLVTSKLVTSKHLRQCCVAFEYLMQCGGDDSHGARTHPCGLCLLCSLLSPLWHPAAVPLHSGAPALSQHPCHRRLHHPHHPCHHHAHHPCRALLHHHGLGPCPYPVAPALVEGRSWLYPAIWHGRCTTICTIMLQESEMHCTWHDALEP